jgi:acyltransferase
MRIAWIDTLRGLGIIFIVLGHLYVTEARLTYLYSFHLPLFFFISGHFFDERRYPDFQTALARGFRTRIVPYLFFYLISFVVMVIRDSWMSGSDFLETLVAGGLDLFTVERISDVAYATGDRLERVENVALWFLPCLFLTETGFFALQKIVKGDMKKLWLAIFGISLAAYIESLYVTMPLPWTINGALTGLFFYGLGFMTKERSQQRISSTLENNKTMVLLVWIAAMILSVFLAFLNGRIDMNTNKYGNYLYFYAAAVSSIVSYTLLSRMLPGVRWLSYLGRNSMIIFGLHLPVVNAVLTARNAVLPFVVSLLSKSRLTAVMSEDIVVAVCGMATLLVLIPCIFLINNYFPFIIGKKSTA